MKSIETRKEECRRGCIKMGWTSAAKELEGPIKIERLEFLEGYLKRMKKRR